MASYAALVSLMRTIESLLHSSDHIPLLPPGGPQILQSAYNEALRLKQVVQLLDRLVSYSDDDLLDGCSSGASTSYWLKTISVEVSANVFESLLSTQFPTESQLVQFSSESNKSFQELIKLCFSGTMNVTDGRIGEAVRELDGVLESLLLAFGKEPIHLMSVDLVRAKRVIESVTGTMKTIMNEEESMKEGDGEKKSKMVEFQDEFPRTINMFSDILEFVKQVISKFEPFIKRMDRNRDSSSSERLDALDGHIREAACKLHDLVESHELNLSPSHPDCHPLTPFSQLDLVEINQYINSFIELKDEYIKEFSNTSPEEREKEDDDAVVSSRVDFDGKTKSKMVGLCDEVHELRRLLTSPRCSYGGIYSIVGMAGIGKTALVKEVFEAPAILSHFDCRTWVTIGLIHQLSDILRSILAQVDPETDKVHTRDGDDPSLADLERMISVSLNDKAHLIVFDDVWDSDTLDHLITSLPNKNEKSRVLVTTRLRGLTYNDWCRLYYQEKHFMSKEESWDLLREKVFGDEQCPPQLEKYGKKIAENCDGLPLTIVTVAHFLSEAEKTTEYWNKVAEKQNSVFEDAYDQMSKKLFPSYKYLPQHLKVCFLYMGAFPQNYEISCSKLTKLWSSEGFLEPIPKIKFERFVQDCLKELDCASLVMVHKKNKYTKTKTCSLHSAFWHMCIKEARKNKFAHVLNSYADGLAEDIENQRRLCIHNNILFGIKDVYSSVSSVSNVRSILCTGQYHQYPVPICSTSRFLRVLDALTIRCYEFPLEVVKMVHLRYLAITISNEIIPSSILKLSNLQCLIIQRHLNIKSSPYPTYLPIEIWDMKELKHIQIVGSDLQEPFGDAVLSCLSTLLDVSARSCTEGVFSRIPNLKKLGVRIELAPDADEPLNCFDHLSHLHKLKSLKCVVVNPFLRSEVVMASPRLPTFSSGLNKLSLSGFGYPWEDMDVIATLPNLQVLKLRLYAFRGPKWETKDRGFRRLDFLLIEDTDLVQFTIKGRCFESLRYLSIKHCYKLQVIPMEFNWSLFDIEVVDCNRLAEACANRIRGSLINMQN